MPGAAEELLADHRPATVVHLAARVGGIGYNQAQPAPLYLANLLMGTHVIEAARHAPTVDKTVLLGTVCSYPKFTPVPFREDSLWDGYPEETNAPYGMAKKAHLVHAQVNAAQYGQRFAYLIPTNLYGPGRQVPPGVSHVIPALIKKTVEAVEAGEPTRSTCGAPARASREYLYVDDAAEAIVLAAESHEGVEPINLGTDREVTIRETVETIARLVGFEGELRWDPTKPDGQPRRRVDASRAEQLLGWRAQMPFERGPARARSTGTSPTGTKPNADPTEALPNLGGILTTSRSGRDPSQQVRRIPPGSRSAPVADQEEAPVAMRPGMLRALSRMTTCVPIACVGRQCDTLATMTTALLVHSPLVGPATMRPLADAVGALGWTVSVPDLREAVMSPETFASRAAAAAGAADVVVGHSGAGAVVPVIGEQVGARRRWSSTPSCRTRRRRPDRRRASSGCSTPSRRPTDCRHRGTPGGRATPCAS